MSTQLPTKLLPAVKSPGRPRRSYPAVVHMHDGSYRHVTTEGATPAEAAGEAILLTCGSLRPALAPDRVDVEGASYEVDEWCEARIFMIPSCTGYADGSRERLQAERALFHLRAADDALSGLAASARERDDARAARYDAAAVCQIATRLRDLADRRGGSR